MADHPNVTALREVLEGFDARGVDAFSDALADDVVWHSLGVEDLHGKDAVLAAWTALTDNYDFSTDVHDVVGNDDHVVGLVLATVRSGDREITYRVAEIVHMSDGKITERWAFTDDAQSIVDFFSES